jgi:hypothetical protein
MFPAQRPERERAERSEVSLAQRTSAPHPTGLIQKCASAAERYSEFRAGSERQKSFRFLGVPSVRLTATCASHRQPSTPARAMTTNFQAFPSAGRERATEKVKSTISGVHSAIYKASNRPSDAAPIQPAGVYRPQSGCEMQACPLTHESTSAERG